MKAAECIRAILDTHRAGCGQECSDLEGDRRTALCSSADRGYADGDL
jgi:hypothetical protein